MYRKKVFGIFYHIPSVSDAHNSAACFENFENNISKFAHLSEVFDNEKVPDLLNWKVTSD